MRTFLKHYVLNQLITFCKALKVFCIMLLKVDKLEAMLGDLVRSTGIMYNFNLSEGEKKDVDRCFLMLRDMAGYVRDKLSHPEEKESKKNVVKDDTDVMAEEQNFEFVESFRKYKSLREFWE